MMLEQFQTEARENYIIAALWSSTDDTGEPLDNTYDTDDIDAATLDTMHAECDAFIAEHWALIQQTGQSPEQCGHDFWLTRNGHGVGFWDRGYPKALGDALTEASKAEGSRDLYVADGVVYQA